ncbi:MAG: PAS domain-containing protein, partial [Caldimonas sp.]
MASESGFAALADGPLVSTAAYPPAPWAGGQPARPAEDETEARFSSQFTAEWLALLFGLAVVGVLIAWSLLKAHESLDATERDRLRVQARVVDDNVGQHLEGMNRALASVRDDFLAAPVHSVSTLLSVRMKSLSDAIPGVRSMALLDADGTVVASSVDALLGRDFADRDYFLAARRGDAQTLYVPAPLKTPLGNYTVIFVRAIRAENGSFAGAVAAALEPEYFKVLLRSVLYAPDMYVSLGHGDGKTFVTMPEDPRRIEGQSHPAFAAMGRERGAEGETRIAVGATPGSSEQRMTALARISPPALRMNKPLAIAVSRAMPELFAPWRQQALATLTFYALLGAGAAFGLYRGQWRRKSYAVLEASAERERRKNAEQLELALEGAELGLWDWDVANDRFFTSGEVVRRLLGYAPGELGHSGAAWRDLVHRDDAERLISTIEAHFRRETAAYECEFRVRHKDGHWVWLLSRGKVVERDGLDTPVRMTGTHMDLTRRKSAEAEAERSAEMLRRTGELAHIGGWELDLTTMRYDWTEQVFRIHELEPGPTPRLDDAMNHYP